MSDSIRRIEQLLEVPFCETLDAAEKLLDPKNRVSLDALPDGLVEEDFAPMIDAELDAKARLTELLKCLTDAERKVVLMRHDLDGAHGNTYPEIAAALDMSVGWVYKVYNRAMDKLREKGG
ncbi:MAG: sigma factor-like helix-turn-helix DNA-binding protein [Chloroflexota bacterium]